MKEFAARRYLLIALRAIPQSFILNSPFSISLHKLSFSVHPYFRGETMETITFTADLERNIRMMQSCSGTTIRLSYGVPSVKTDCAARCFSLTAW